MSALLSDVFSRWESRVTPAQKQVASKRKSVKAQRKQSAKSKVEAKQHSCWLYGEDKAGNPLKGYVAHCVECMKVSDVPSEQDGWAPPAAFDVWVKRNFDAKFSSPAAAHDAGRSDVVLAYERYVRDVFGLTFTKSAFDRIVRREQVKQAQGLGDLGLLGYSADDIVDLALLYAWAEHIKHYVISIGADAETAAHISQALRDTRSDDELAVIAELEADGRYAYGSDGRLRKQANSLAVRHARERIALRAELKESGLLDQFSTYVPTAGQVYRQVKHVFREGMREWRSTIEGLSRDGVLPESIDALADTPLGVGSVVSAEAQYFTSTTVDETHLTREAWLDAYKAKHDLLPAEATALAVTEALIKGWSLYEVREQFPTERAFRDALRNAEELFATAA